MKVFKDFKNRKLPNLNTRKNALASSGRTMKYKISIFQIWKDWKDAEMRKAVSELQ